MDGLVQAQQGEVVVQLAGEPALVTVQYSTVQYSTALYSTAPVVSRVGHGAGHSPLLTLGLGRVEAEVLLAKQHHAGPPAQLLYRIVRYQRIRRQAISIRRQNFNPSEKTTQTAPGPSILL